MKYKYTIRELPVDERPREKLYQYGPRSLSNTELLAIIIRTGSKNESALEVARNILNIEQDRVASLSAMTLEELMTIDGVGQCKAAQIMSAIELGRRILTQHPMDPRKIGSPMDVSDLLMEDMQHLKKEYFKTILLDTKNKVIKIENTSIGSLNASIVHPREVFKGAIKRSSASIILVHNHPSGDPTPSKEDIHITKRLIDCGELLGIKVLDHVILGSRRYISLKEENII